MEIIESAIPEVKILRPRVFQDDRGFFQESYNRKTLSEEGISLDFVQDNHSLSLEKGTIRGLHFQKGPHEQSKLIRVVKGKILDVIVDIRLGSKTFGEYVSVELSDDNYQQVLIPKGFAHGFCTLENDTHVCYKIDEYYYPESNCGILWNDSDIGIDWPVDSPILSEQDLKWSSLKDTIK